MRKIAISYRRKDADAIAGRIRDRIAQHFGQDLIFMDIDNIPLGTDFRKHIQEVLHQNEILLAIIGPNWTAPASGAQARIFDPTDPVRIEVETALQRGVPTIPVLVSGASMPSPDELPESLKELPFYNATEISAGVDFHPHVDRLIRAMEQILKDKSPPSSVKPVKTVVSAKWLVAGGGLLACAILGGIIFAAYHFGAETARAPTAQSSPAPAAPVQTTQATSEPAKPPAPVHNAAAASAPIDPGAEAKAAAEACEPGSVPVFYDNFKTVDPAWEGLGTDPRAGFYVADGQLVVATRAKSYLAIIRQGALRIGSLCVEITSPPTVKDLGGTEAGLMPWAHDPKNNLLVLIIPDGSYEIIKTTDGSESTLADAKSDAVKSGPQAVNSVKIAKANDTDTLYINGRKIKEFKSQPGKDDNYVGVYASSEEAQISEWHFTNIVMTQPNYGKEFTDFGVPPQDALQQSVAGHTPTAIPGAKVITTSELSAAIQHGSLDGSPFVAADTLDSQHEKTIRGAKRIPQKNGYAGSLDDDTQQSLRAQLNSLTKNHPSMPIVFFCEGVGCWESYNAALRAEKMGFTRVYWYRGGLDAWKEAGLPMN
jgi:PQQ-dependent catabolism-associated CXXCW motif protein